VDALAVLLAVKSEGRIGRPRLTRLLGLGDRRARNLINMLERVGLIVKSRGGSGLSECSERLLSLAGVHFLGDFTCCTLSSRGLRGDRVVAARDEIAILLGEPGRLLLIGWAGGGVVEAPGAPEEALEPLGSLLGECARLAGGGAAYALFRGGGCYRCCASFIQAALASSLLPDL